MLFSEQTLRRLRLLKVSGRHFVNVSDREGGGRFD